MEEILSGFSSDQLKVYTQEIQAMKDPLLLKAKQDFESEKAKQQRIIDGIDLMRQEISNTIIKTKTEILTSISRDPTEYLAEK